MSAAHRPSPWLTRRRVLGLGALAAVPAVTLAVRGARSPDAPGAGAAPAPAVSSQPPTSAPALRVVTDGGGPVPFVAGKAMLGSYVGLKGKTLEQSLRLRRQQLGRDQRIVNLFYDWTDILLSAAPELPARTVPMISWAGTKYADITSGASDALIARAARRVARYGKPVMLRFAWEMNGGWFEWGGAKNGGHSEGYVKSWRRIHKIFRDAGVRNASWVWSPNWNSSPTAAWNTPQSYYPGDAYVDWVGVSGYNLHRESPEALFDGIYQLYAAKKPIVVTEVGAVDRGGRTKADWITVFDQWVQDRPGVGAVVWFDTDTHPGYDEKWRVDTDPQSLAAYREMATGPRFSG
ncbi:glycosyl hydrolase family 26 [Krasilnikovia cinnamomea]|uniref:Glycosyl hydrolase family 26 n=1 Tax=Krasilnikovia cinnamomea TaxID=349313 RepID=A0A4Q7ZDR4_9ACTN|nr:glycosyl hydrolase [Krasilnikovia cinnamomea]RZU48394.1 glycosyl hydrolase family 26 [Krasilnikovia cinnamomea]